MNRNRAISGVAHARAAFLGVIVIAAMPLARANTFTVTTTADSGVGSLRQAILDANAMTVTGGTACAPHDIVFNIVGTGVRTIRPTSPLPAIAIPITLDGYTQPGASENTLNTGTNAQIRIELDGSLAGGADALNIAASGGGNVCAGSGTVIRGLAINRFGGAAIAMGQDSCGVGQVCNIGNVRISGNFIGTDATGMIALGNGASTGRAALIFGSRASFNVVGERTAQEGGSTDPTPSVRNLISGNAGDAIVMSSSVANARSEAHRIRNNYIGLDATGTNSLPNGGRGIAMLAGSSAVSIYDNLISGNVGDGVTILDTPFSGTAVIGNGIGIGLGGVALGNGGNGITIAAAARSITVGRRYAFVLPGIAAIANNAGAGISVGDDAQMDLVNGSIGRNAGLAIDLAPAGININDPLDADMGPNEGLNAPVLTSAAVVAGTGTITGELDAAPNNNYEIHFYINDTCAANGSGDGQTWLSLGQPPIVQLTTNASGHGTFTTTTSFLPPGKFLSALTRRFSTQPGVTALIVSEFSACRQIEPTPPLFADSFE
jgi:hypothetical protein